MKLRETTDTGSPRWPHVAIFNPPALTADACESVLRASYGRPSYITATMGQRMADELATSGRYRIGWQLWEVI